MDKLAEPSASTEPQRWGFHRGLRRGFAIAAVILWAAMMLLGGSGAAWDESLYRQLYAADNDVLARNARLLTQLGGWRVLVPVAILATIMLAFSRRQRAGLLLIMVFGGRLLVEMQKLIVDRDRPGVSPHLEAVSSMSFPSAHAANSMITYVGIALLIPVGQRYRAVAIGVALALALQSGWGRIALGVHWPSDVIGGWAFGAFWIMICMRLASARPEADAAAPAPERGTLRGRAALLIRRRRRMDSKRADIARDTDDSELIDRVEPAPSHSGASGGDLQRDVASQAEEEHEIGNNRGVTRVSGEDKAEDGDVPTLPNRN